MVRVVLPSTVWRLCSAVHIVNIESKSFFYSNTRMVLILFKCPSIVFDKMTVSSQFLIAVNGTHDTFILSPKSNSPIVSLNIYSEYRLNSRGDSITPLSNSTLCCGMFLLASDAGLDQKLFHTQ